MAPRFREFDFTEMLLKIKIDVRLGAVSGYACLLGWQTHPIPGRLFNTHKGTPWFILYLCGTDFGYSLNNVGRRT